MFNQSLIPEIEARTAADAVELAARMAADTTESAARAAGDVALDTLRANGDATLLAQLTALSTVAAQVGSGAATTLSRAALAVAITNIGSDGSTMTVDTSGAHGLTDGDYVKVVGCATSAYNVSLGPINVTSANQFTAPTTVPLTATAHSGTVCTIGLFVASTTGYVAGQLVEVVNDTASTDADVHVSTIASIASGRLMLTDPVPTSWSGSSKASTGRPVTGTIKALELARGGYASLARRMDGIDRFPGAMRLAAGVTAGVSTTITLRTVPQQSGGYLLIDPSTECDVVKMAGVVGATITLDRAVTYSHAADDVVIWVPDSTFDIVHFGAKVDGTDDSTAVIRANSTAQMYGGTVRFPSGITRVDSKILFPNNSGVTPPKQNTVRWTGAGAYFNGQGGSPVAGTILDLRYGGVGDANEDFKVDTRGLGVFEIDHMCVADLGSSSIPFFRTTNTTILAHHNGFIGNPAKSGTNCDQDVFVLGGNRTGARVYNGANNAPFQGYGTTIEHNYFNKIRRAVLTYDDVNGADFNFNKVWAGCGSNIGAAAAAFDITGSDQPNVSNRLIGNLIEMPGYVYAIALRNATNHILIANDGYDAVNGVAEAVVAILGTSAHNTIIEGWGTDAYNPYTLNVTSSDDNTIITAHSGEQTSFGGPVVFKTTLTAGVEVATYFKASKGSNGFKIQPAAVTTDGSTLFEVLRSAVEVSNASASIYRLIQTGKITMRGIAAGNIDYLDASGATVLTLDQNGKRWTGNGTGFFEFNTGGGGGAFQVKAASLAFYDTAGVLIGQFLASNGQWRLGTAGDTNYYRSAANELKTDDHFVAADGIQTKYLSGAGRATIADSDFTAVPANGSTAVLHNTTDGVSRMAVRVNNVWKYTTVT